ncbi:MAG: iron-containing alcohol dehydrogenase [Gammaproteobacteria bacterium]|nr:MAG: iron-containing alcohol dehydrogenase [Gammaproteobacteria bacterium]
MIPAFSIARLPRIAYGRGRIEELPAYCRRHGQRLLLLTGRASFVESPGWPRLQEGFAREGLEWSREVIAGEPSPDEVDAIAMKYRDRNIDVVAAIGGGSVLDAGKAVAGLLRVPHSVMDFLEGVGPELPYPGPATPFIAVPTTAGTGSEATKNAVLSRQGPDGFKKSFRDERLVPEVALVDPALLATCPPEQIAANGMDAFTQLLESFVSLRANPLTDALVRQGLVHVREALLRWYTLGAAAENEQDRMALASLYSGIALAQTGLGSVHGLASPLGAFFPIPHGVVCGRLVAEATRVNIEALQAREPHHPALGRYAEAGRILARDGNLEDAEARRRLVALLHDWTASMRLPRLSDYGVTRDDFPRIVANSRGSSMRTNPIVLTDEEITAILEACL